jgi:hypothetical protein
MDQYLRPGKIFFNDILMVAGITAEENNLPFNPAQGRAGFPVQDLKILETRRSHNGLMLRIKPGIWGRAD